MITFTKDATVLTMRNPNYGDGRSTLTGAKYHIMMNKSIGSYRYKTKSKFILDLTLTKAQYTNLLTFQVLTVGQAFTYKDPNDDTHTVKLITNPIEAAVHYDGDCELYNLKLELAGA